MRMKELLLLFILLVGLSASVTTVENGHAIAAIYPDGEYMWVAIEGGDIEKRNLKGEVVENYTPETTGILGRYSALYVDSKGDVHVGSNRGLYCFDGVEWSGYEFIDDENPTIYVMSFAEDYDGNTTAILIFNGFWKKEGEQWQIAEHLYEGKNIWHQSIDIAGRHWVIGQDFVSYVDEDNKIKKFGMTEGFKSVESFYDMACAVDTTVYFATRYSGLVAFKDGKVQKVYKSGNGLKSDWLWNVTTTKDRSVWISYHKAVSRGITKLAGSKRVHYTTTEGLPSNTIKDLKTASDDAVWVATASGLAIVRDEGVAVTAEKSFQKLSFHTEISNGELHITAPQKISQITLHSLHGRQIAERAVYNQRECTFSLEQLTTGMVLVTALMENGFSRTEKVVIK